MTIHRLRSVSTATDPVLVSGLGTVTAALPASADYAGTIPSPYPLLLARAASST